MYYFVLQSIQNNNKKQLRELVWNYCKVLKFSDDRKLCCNLPKFQTKRPNLRVFPQKDANGIAHSEDPDQTAPLGAVGSGFALFAKTYLSEKLRVITVVKFILNVQR